MKDRALHELLNDLNGSITETSAGEPKFHDPRCEPEPLGESNFHLIPEEAPEDREVSFVDGVAVGAKNNA